MKPFIDRSDAGRQLAKLLKPYQGTHAVVLALPRGGVPVAYEVAKALNLPMDLVLAKKIGHPGNPEYAIGAVSLTDEYLEPHAEVSEAYVNAEKTKVRSRLREMQQLFLGRRPALPLKGRTVIVVDDGIATGNTLQATLKMLRKAAPASIVIAVPVAPPAALQKLASVADEVVCVHTPEVFWGVDGFYEDFAQVSDEEVAAIMALLKKDNTLSNDRG